MNPFEALALIALIVCISGVIVVERLLGPGRRSGEERLRLAEQREQELLLRIGELERHNDELRQQLEWHRRLLEAQDRIVQQLGAPAAAGDPSKRLTPPAAPGG